MNRPFAGTMFSLAASLALGACGSNSSGATYESGGYAYVDGCQTFASCQACTPQDGCGWCYNADGTGQCASSPDQCATEEFEWTWNPSGCRVAATASTVATPDAGEPAETTSDGATADSAAGPCIVPAGANSVTESGDGATGCLVVSGTACPASSYEIGCGGATPDPSLGCQIQTAPVTPGASYYCCPCAE
jgi:hypothetical protein